MKITIRFTDSKIQTIENIDNELYDEIVDHFNNTNPFQQISSIDFSIWINKRNVYSIVFEKE